MTNIGPDECRDSTRKNIPWYVNGTLSREESVALQEHMKGCSDCRADVESHSSMRASVLGRDIEPIMPAISSADILGREKHPVNSPEQRFSRRLSSRMAAAAGITAISIVFFASSYLQRESAQPNRIFETATSPGSIGHVDYVLQVRFEDSLSDEQRRWVAEEMQGVVKWSVNSSGVYEVHIQLAAPTLAILVQYEQHVVSIEGVESAQFTALQLPMR